MKYCLEKQVKSHAEWCSVGQEHFLHYEKVLFRIMQVGKYREVHFYKIIHAPWIFIWVSGDTNKLSRRIFGVWGFDVESQLPYLRWLGTWVLSSPLMRNLNDASICRMDGHNPIHN